MRDAHVLITVTITITFTVTLSFTNSVLRAVHLSHYISCCFLFIPILESNELKGQFISFDTAKYRHHVIEDLI